MKIMVFDVPAEHGGALTILKQYYEEAVNDKNNDWYFVISTPELVEIKNVRVLRFPWVKKSWFHRLYFDKFVAHKIVLQYQADEVLSLQNVIVEGVRCKQTLYLHQPLPFVEKRYRITEDAKLWAYQNLISRMIYKSVRKADKVIVQTKWMKDVCVSKLKVMSEKIAVIPPKINIKINRYFEPKEKHLHTFFYPANGFIYKKHKVIVDAALLLKERGVSDYKIIFTLQGDENKHIEGLFKQVKKNNLPIEFIGAITQEQVFDYYSRSVLIFPSYIETFGLPMLEARLHHTPVLASDMPFSHEILDGYEKVRFFDVEDVAELAEIMEQSQEYYKTRILFD